MGVLGPVDDTIIQINYQVVPCKRIHDSLGFWIPRHRLRILCQSNSEDSGFLELYSGFQIPGFLILQENFTRKISRIPESLTWGESVKFFLSIWPPAVIFSDLFSCSLD